MCSYADANASWLVMRAGERRPLKPYRLYQNHPPAAPSTRRGTKIPAAIAPLLDFLGAGMAFELGEACELADAFAGGVELALAPRLGVELGLEVLLALEPGLDVTLEVGDALAVGNGVAVGATGRAGTYATACGSMLPGRHNGAAQMATTLTVY